MAWDSWSAFFEMGGYGRYVWGSLGMVAALIALELLQLRARRRRLRTDAGEVAP